MSMWSKIGWGSGCRIMEGEHGEGGVVVDIPMINPLPLYKVDEIIRRHNLTQAEASMPQTKPEAGT